MKTKIYFENHEDNKTMKIKIYFENHEDKNIF